MVRQLVVGVDDVDDAHGIVDWVVNFGHEQNARVTVVHAVPRVSVWLIAGVQVDATEYVADRRAAVTHDVVVPMRKRGLVAEAVVAVSGPAELLVTTARRRSADLIVVGAPRGHRKHHFAPHDPIVGSTVRELERSSPVPIVVVPRTYSVVAPRSSARI